jgi:uncharacterized protein
MDIDLTRLTATETLVQGDVVIPDGDGRGSLADDGITFPGPVTVDARARRVKDRVLVAGTVRGAATLECGRCLARFERPLEIMFEVRFTDAVTGGARAHEARPARHGTHDEPEETTGADEDADVTPLPAGTRFLSVGEIAREQVLLDLPIRPLCRESCRGLCPRCGCDMNEGDCACATEAAAVDPRLAELGEIKRKLERT